MRKVVDDPRLMIKVCDLFYNQNASQQQICEELNLSRPTVGRILNSAREQGIVQIHIPNLDIVDHWEIEQQLEKKYGLRQVMVVDSDGTGEDLETALGSAAARLLQYLIKDQDIVGVSMGSTLYHMATEIAEGTAEHVTFVPMIGGMGRLRTELHSNSIAERLAKAYHGTFIPVHAPARVSNALVRGELMKEESLSAAVELMKKLDVALVGIGYPNERSAIKATGYYKENEIDSLIQREVAGEVCMQFFDVHGDTTPYKKDNRVIGIDIHKLRNVPVSVGIAGGKEKISAIKGAIAGRYINRLVTDMQCALALLSDEE